MLVWQDRLPHLQRGRTSKKKLLEHGGNIVDAGMLHHVFETARANALIHSLAADSPALDWQNSDDAWKLDSAKALVKVFRHWGGRREAMRDFYRRLLRKLESVKGIAKKG